MSTRLTDSITAAAATVIVWMSGWQRGLAPRELIQPGPFVGGVFIAVVIELLFARWPERMSRLWKRPVVRIASPISLVLVTHFAGNREDGTIHAATLGGLAGYFGLLAGIVSGLVSDPGT